MRAGTVAEQLNRHGGAPRGVRASVAPWLVRPGGKARSAKWTSLPSAPLRRSLAAVSVVALLVVASGLVTGPAYGASSRLQVTFIGDSVPASIKYVPSAERALRRGLDVRLDMKVCRRLIQPSCSFNGSTPSSALQAVKAYGRTLSDVLVVYVGYNESAEGYHAGIDRVMRAALAQGAQGVVWVTLKEQRDIYRGTNVAIRTAARRWPQLQVADWDAYSAGKPWFRGDGLHMGTTGANALADFLRPYIMRAS